MTLTTAAASVAPRRTPSAAVLFEQDVHVERASCDPVLQSCAVQILHGDEGTPVLLVDFVDGADVGMVQGRGGFGLALKPAESLQVLRNVIGQELRAAKRSSLTSWAL
jgi:hypothetical protein